MLSAALLISMTTLTAFAYSGEESQKSEAAISTESVPVEESETAEMDDAIGIVDTESSNLNGDTVGGSLTPDGNLTLVDDLGSAADEGQQFITLVTKNGNTFYLVIDRNDKGEENVHFMNLVDEADLLALMDEEETEKYQEPVVTEPIVTEKPQETIKPKPEEEPEPEKKSSAMPLLLLFLVGIGGAGGFLYFKVKGKKKPDKPAAADPDIDYEDEENEIDLPNDENIDDSDGEEIEDSYVDDDYDEEEKE